VRFRAGDGRIGFGALEDEQIVEYDGDIFDGPRRTARRIGLHDCTLESPCVPSKVIALWNNFGELGAKLGKAAPSHPLYFIKSPTSVIGPGAPIRRPRSYGGKIAFEGELGIVIGRHCKDVAPGDAAGFIFGYTCVNDVTAIGILNENADFAQWTRSKSFDTFGCLGPSIRSDFHWPGARVTTRLDGELRQNYPLADMIMAPERLVSLISGDMSLLPGDVIACGTSLGVGSIKDGSSVEVTIDGIGSLVNTLASAGT
jgi:2-keto-4-pentenoate hydratase/2-oxohepta-3-ene-1,7-dioic acid hydratase in catechol pathway